MFTEITSALHRLALGSCDSAVHSNASIAGKSGHGGVVDEWIQAVFVSGQDSNRFQTGQEAGGLQLPVQETEHQLAQMLHGTTIHQVRGFSRKNKMDGNRRILLTACGPSILINRVNQLQIVNNF